MRFTRSVLLVVCVGIPGCGGCGTPVADAGTDAGAPVTPTDAGVGCAIGAETCPCTNGGACDLGLTCLSGLCVDASPLLDGGPGTMPDGGVLPSITEVLAAPAQLNIGAAVQLTVTASDAETCTSSPDAGPLVGPSPFVTTAHPDDDTTYTVTCSNSVGSVIDTSNLVQVASIKDVVATPVANDVGQPINLSWTANHATNCEVADGDGGVLLADGGDVTIGAPSGTRAYVVDCDGFDGGVSATGEATGFQIVSFEAVDDEIPPAATAALTWEVVGFDSCDLTSDPDAGVVLDAGGDGEDAWSGMIEESITFTLSCRHDGAGQTREMTETVDVEPVVLSFDATAVAGELVLEWTTAGATGCTITLDGADHVVLNEAALGAGMMTMTDPGTGPRVTYDLSCTGSGPTVGTSGTPRDVWWGNADKSHVPPVGGASPDIDGVRVVVGNLTISNADYSDLTALSTLRAVSGSFTLLNITTLPNLNGLGALERVGALTIDNCDALSSLTSSHVGALSVVEGTLLIQNNDELGLPGAVDDVELNALTTLGGLNVNNNPDLTNLRIPNVSSTAGSVLIDTNSTLGIIDLSQLSAIGMAFTLNDNDGVDPALGTQATFLLPSLTSVGTTFTISNHIAYCTTNADAVATAAGRVPGVDANIFGNAGC